MEEIILQYLLSDGKYFKKCYPFLSKNHFESIESQELFKIISNYYNEYKNIPSNREVLTEIKQIKQPEYRKSVADRFKSVLSNKDDINEEYLVTKTEEHIKNKEFMDFLIHNAEGIQKGDVNLSQALKDVTDINKVSLTDNKGIDFSDIEARIEYYKQRLTGIKTGLESLDSTIGGGFRPKTLSIISAKSGGGKSLFGSSIASGMLLNKSNVLVVTLEMSDFEYFKRVDANVLDLDISSLKDIEPEVIRSKFNKLNGKVGKLKSVEYPSGRFSALMLENLLDSLKTSENFIPDIIIIDYLALMKSDRYSSISNSNSYYTSVAEDVRAVAQTHNLAIISFSQLTRGTESEMSQDSVSLAKGIYETADNFFFIMNNKDMKENGEIALIVDKNRNTGITGKTLLFGIDYSKMRIYDSDIIDSNISGMDMLESSVSLSNAGVDDLDIGGFNF